MLNVPIATKRHGHTVENLWRFGAVAALDMWLLVVGIIFVSYAVIEPNRSYILATSSDQRAYKTRVGLVLGAGVTPQGKPYKELQSRLDVAADALQKGYVQKLIVSGDNRVTHYDEPTAMKRYLVEQKHIDAHLVVRDFAGRSTYESCERAVKIFGQRRLVIFSASSHLPRAIYLCRHFGIEAYGMASYVEANNSKRREVLARVKALYNLCIKGERTVLGEKVDI